MKKLVKIFSCLIFVLLMTTSVYAGTECGSSNSFSGTAGSSYGQAGGGGSCVPPCYTTHIAGLRFRLYSYKDGKLTPLGKGVDVWNQNSTIIITTAGKYSDPNTDFLNNRLKNSCSNNGNYQAMNSTFSLNSDQYKTRNVYFDSSIGSLGSFNFGEYILRYNSKGEPSNGWLYENLYKKILTSSDENNKFVKNLWGVEIKDLVKNGENIYIGSEILQRIDTNDADSWMRNMYGFSNQKLYFGTVSDFAPIYGVGSAYISLYNLDSKVGALATSGNVSGSYKFQIVNPANTVVSGQTTYQGYSGHVFGHLSGVQALINASYNADCNKTIGMAIFHFSSQCPGCINSCERDCGDIYPDDTSYERKICAVGWCKQNDPDNKTCVNECTKPTSDLGCPDVDKKPGNGVCHTYYNSATGTQTKDKSLGNVCPAELSVDNKETLETTVCYDDSTEYTVVDESGKSTKGGQYTLSKTKYYRIDCNEKVELSELPTERRVQVSQSGTSSLYLGYKMLYDKTCKLLFKATKDGKSGDGWITEKAATTPKAYTSGKNACKPQDSSKKMLKIDYDICAANRTKYDATNSKAKAKSEDDKKTYDAIIEASDTALSELNNVKKMARVRLKNVSALDYREGEPFDNKATIEIVEESKTSTDIKELTLEPVSCIDGNDTITTRCTLENNKSMTMSTGNTVICGDENNKKKATIENDVSSYKKTVYYALPSMWINAQVTDAGKAFTSKEACEKSGATGEKALCIKKDNVWVFNPIDESITNTAYTKLKEKRSFSISLKNYGSCGQFEYDMSCKYKFEDDKVCSACTNYTYGTDAYEACYEKNCSCESYCGSNVACRSKYCPSNCEGCGWSEEDICPPTCKSDCQASAGGSTSNEKYITCIYDSCCAADCKGETGCIYDCCARSCNEKTQQLGWTQDKYKACMTECKCPNGSCGEDYLYRSIVMNDPFPGRESGKNWYNKVEYITKSDESLTKYADKTDGKTGDYEYKVTITNDDIKEIKNKMNTTYEVFKKSDKAKSKIGPNVYCSSMLHDYLKNGQVEFGRFGSGSGCGIR